MKRKCGNLFLALLAVFWLLRPTVGRAEEPNRWQFKAGFTYEEGDFGTDVTTKTLYAPFTIRYLGDQFDLGLTVPYIDQETSRSVTVVGGVPTRIRGRGATTDTVKQSASGLGDVILKARFFLLDDPGSASPIPAVSPFYRVKFPTADEDEGLGTGEFDHGFGLEFDKAIEDYFLFAHVAYTVIGEPPGTDLNNRFSAGGGVGRRFLKDLSASVSLAWQQSLVDGGDDPVDLFFDLSWRVLQDLNVSPFASFGLTEGSPDYGVGLEVSYRFGRGWDLGALRPERSTRGQVP